MPANHPFNTSEIMFQMVMPPMMTPIAPIPIASIKKFFLSAIYYCVFCVLIIANVPSIASSNRTVSVA